ncbi:MAG TPA: AmmeMemoRadiSam system protein A [Anaeromyxobacteraceae bacterium]|nr:AmmeMemoRadiSam system protein A [Anaeromyxobacteraceae bacterium]
MSDVTLLSRVERSALLGVARASLRHHAGLGPEPEIPLAGALGEPRGAFVTLRREGELRGCIGRLQPERSLAQLVGELAVTAATADPRFEPVEVHEVDDLEISISVLQPPRPLRSPEELRVGTDGAVIRLDWHRGVLLPSVAVANGWDARTFLRHTCLKAGLWPEAWEDPRAIVEVFAAEEFGDER